MRHAGFFLCRSFPRQVKHCTRFTIRAIAWHFIVYCFPIIASIPRANQEIFLSCSPCNLSSLDQPFFSACEMHTTEKEKTTRRVEKVQGSLDAESEKFRILPCRFSIFTRTRLLNVIKVKLHNDFFGIFFSMRNWISDCGVNLHDLCSAVGSESWN
jgi:hypothetical protein